MSEEYLGPHQRWRANSISGAGRTELCLWVCREIRWQLLDGTEKEHHYTCSVGGSRVADIDPDYLLCRLVGVPLGRLTPWLAAHRVELDIFTSGQLWADGNARQVVVTWHHESNTWQSKETA